MEKKHDRGGTDLTEQVAAWFESFEKRFFNELKHNFMEDQQLDWQQLTHWHLELIAKVTALHAAEENEGNQQATDAVLSVEEALKMSADGLRGHRIYTLKNAENMVCDCIGDLHSDPESLMQLLKETGFIQSCLAGAPHRLVFMGDYVDRGKAHLALLGRLLTLKIAFPDRVFLLRGNHDGGIIEGPDQVKLPYRKPDDEPDEDYFPTYLIKLNKHHPETEPLLKAYLDFFNTLGQLAFIQTGEKITLAVHGGVPRPVLQDGHYFSYLKHLSELSDVNFIDAHGRTMVQNIMWSDPYKGSGELREGMGRYYFTEAQYDDFASTIGIDQMLRGHQYMDEGFECHFDGKVHTIFSSGTWPRLILNPMTAYPQVAAKWARILPSGGIEIHPKKTDISY